MPAQKRGSAAFLKSQRERILLLHETIGNQAVRRLFQSGVIQPKLAIGKPNDRYEQEADRIADHVMRMPESAVRMKPGRTFDNCSPEGNKDQIRLSRRQGAGTATVSLPPDNFISSPGGGLPLDRAARDYFESQMGVDLTPVRIHAGPRAAESAGAINARAYTLGNNVVFGSGEYQPGTTAGKRLLAHELAHVVQQSREPVLRRRIQRQHITMNSGREVGDVAGPGSNLKEDVIEAMDGLHSLWSMSNPDYSSEYPAVKGLPDMSQVPRATIPHTTSAIRNNEQPTLNNAVAASAFGMNLSDSVGTGMQNAKTDIYRLQDYLHVHWFLTDGDYANERSTVNAGADPVSTGIIPETLAGITKLKIAKVAGGTRSHDVFGGTRAITATQRGKVEAILIPGASAGPGGAVRGPVPDPICSNAPNLEAEIRTTLEPYIHNSAAQFNARKANPPVLPLAQMRSMADIVEDEMEGYFGPYLRGAHHVAGAEYAPGTYRVQNQLKDQSATLQWQNPDGRKSWVNYWISEQTKNSHHCNQSDLDAVAGKMATDPALIPDIDTTVQSWPAEATGGININPYLRDASANPDEKRTARWDAFTTILHEAIHHLAHPNFVKTYEQYGDNSMQIMKEGFNDLFRQELWSGAGRLRARIATPAYNANRAVIEGGAFPYKDSVVLYHGDYDEIAQARQIQSVIGNANIKAAYFLGHTEYLGLGAGSGGLAPGKSLSGIASYHSKDPAEEGIVETAAGESYAALMTRINARPGTIFDLANKAVPDAGPLPAKVRVAGVRHYTVIADDTLKSVADQNGVSPYDLVRANNLTSEVLVPGRRLLIPIH